MAKLPRPMAISFTETIGLIRATKKGQEAAMYGPLRDLFCEVLGYPRGSVLIDIAGEAGRPDVTCRAPSGRTACPRCCILWGLNALPTGIPPP